ncbi:uncharacterized protein [Rutidosis leptorrhynchoides]|uniref:uncharacterized protein n=1 Tax=Rutidosis leptorrhynchoides TaxID=125765 RepID=UPI003A9A4AAF
MSYYSKSKTELSMIGAEAFALLDDNFTSRPTAPPRRPPPQIFPYQYRAQQTYVFQQIPAERNETVINCYEAVHKYGGSLVVEYPKRKPARFFCREYYRAWSKSPCEPETSLICYLLCYLCAAGSRRLPELPCSYKAVLVLNSFDFQPVGILLFLLLLITGKINSSHTHGYLRSCPISLGAGRSRGSRDTRVRIRVGSWNVGTLSSKARELVNTLRKSKVDILCVQETRWRGEEAVDVDDYRLWFSGSRVARNGVGILIGPRYKDNIVGVDRCSDRIMSVRVVIQEETYMVICAYAPHAGLGDDEKVRFWEALDEVVRSCPADHRLVIGGDLNGHIGTISDGYTGVHGGFGYGVRNEEGRSILEFAVAHELVVANSFFRKTEAQLATFHSGGHSTQIDYLLLRKGDLRACRDCRALTTWTCSTQHRLLVMDLVLQRRVTKRVRPVQPRILWKNLIEGKAETFKTSVLERVEAGMDTVTQVDADQMWNRMASAIRDVAKETLGVAVGTSRGHKSNRESWWISDEVQTKVALKQQRFKELITCRDGTREDRTRAEERYKEANREAKKAVARAKDKAYEDLYRKLDSKEGANDIYRIAKARERRRRDIDNIKFIKDEAGQTLVKEEEIRKRWEGYFSTLFVGEGPGRQEVPQDLGIGQFRNNSFCRRIRKEEDACGKHRVFPDRSRLAPGIGP